MMNLDGFSITEMPHISAFSDTPNKALFELAEAWEGVKESYQKHGKPIPTSSVQKFYSGRFNVRLDKRIHKALALEAA